MKKWSARTEIFSTMPLRSYLIFCLAVAFTFAAIGVVNDLFDLERSDTRHLVVKVLTTAGFSVLWVFMLHRRRSGRAFVVSIVVLALAQTLLLVAVAQLMPAQHRVLSPQQWKAEVALHGFLLLILILFSYGWFGTFFQMEGRRYFAAHTEIELASRIHQQLVPPIHRTSGDIEVYGVSVPSGAVGGDLLDLVEADGAHCAYVADVAGHGVAAGVLMSMVKTAVRMAFSEKPPATTGLLEAVNNALAPLTETSGYATFAYVLVSDQRRVTYSVAAHLPILHFQKSNATIARHTVENFPVAMFPDVTFQTGVIDFQPGDILAIVTMD